MSDVSSIPSWLMSIVAGMFSGLVTGFLSAFGSLAYFGGDTKATLREHSHQLEALGDGGEVRATLDAHDHRLNTLENDVRYEIRAVRDNIHGMRNDMHVSMQELRKELVELIKVISKSAP